MDPVALNISGFLSYRQLVSLNFDGFDLACITGANGAGKSTLLDAITWALFGEARGKDDAVINSQSKAAEVSFDFRYENFLYRVRRYKHKDKTAQLDFFIQTDDGAWKTLSERSLRETQDRIRKSLRLDYETFTNASFFLQGKADQFTTQNAGQRKRILSSILGLDIWEEYKERAAERRKGLESEKQRVDSLIVEIDAELGEEKDRRASLQQKQAALEQLSKEYQTREELVNLYRQRAASLAEKKKNWEELKSRLMTLRERQQEVEDKLALRQAEAQNHASLLASAAQIETAYAEWLAARSELESWENLALRYREQEKKLEEPRRALAAEEARLSARREGLRQQAEMIRAIQASLPRIQQEATRCRQMADELLDRLKTREALQNERNLRNENLTSLESRNRQLKEQMDALKERIDQLESSSGAVCPLCGQPLGNDDRLKLIAALNREGHELAEQYRQNQAAMQQERPLIESLKTELEALTRLERELPVRLKTAGDAEADVAQKQMMVDDWLKTGQPDLEELEARLAAGDFLPEIRANLKEAEAALQALGYDPAAHQAARQREQDGRAAEEQMQALRSARAALGPLEAAIADLSNQRAVFRDDIAALEAQEAQAAEEYQRESAGLPDLDKAEEELRALKETENRARSEVAAANQLVEVLKSRKKRREELAAHRDALAQQILRYKELERAFSKDGIPALLIEQALPEIEQEANDLLDRLSGGTMSVRFVTQRDYKDKKRADLKETLDILIADSVSERPYEMFSGGEAFRVNFAIRLALSRVLARRAGARLQLLVVDEGFGSQDAQGRQRLIEAINLVRADFAKILVITHMDELKDAFPNRIEVEKTPQGSTVSVVVS